MKARVTCLIALALATGGTGVAQPSYTGPVPVAPVSPLPDQRRADYLKRVDEVLAWRASQLKANELTTDMSVVASLLVRGENLDVASRSVIEIMKEPGSGPFWMFPAVSLAYLGRDRLSPEANKAIRDAWRKSMQVRGDTENHWAMYYSSLYLISELYPNDPADSWYTGKSSAENLAESREYLIQWMDLATTIGQGEFNPTHYIGEYAIPMLYLATWASISQRGPRIR
jgi:hypothetical protein